MSTVIYIDKPNDALQDLVLSLSSIYPGRVRSCEAVAITSDVPEIVELLLAMPGGVGAITEKAPAETPKNGKDPAKKRANHKGGPTPANVARQIAELENMPDAGDPPILAGEKNATRFPQSFTWLILSSGKECNSLSTVLRHRKLSPGDRVRHKERGLYEVREKSNGSGLTLHRLDA